MAREALHRRHELVEAIMALVWIGALLVIIGVVVSTLTTLKRGRLSQDEQPLTHEQRDTLEPVGRGRRLSVKADLPGIALVGLGFLLLAIAAFARLGMG
jgi:hypothetical protein